jgi:hypothetical protein
LDVVDYIGLTGRFVFVYVLDDATIVIGSFVQARVVRRWLERGP